MATGRRNACSLLQSAAVAACHADWLPLAHAAACAAMLRLSQQAQLLEGGLAPPASRQGACKGKGSGGVAMLRQRRSDQQAHRRRHSTGPGAAGNHRTCSCRHSPVRLQ